jgi:D-alanyl-D-alanine carboxypeptidase/D-alanyl-D-alanine-endopeptidase (penicillin-binding protein 4)
VDVDGDGIALDLLAPAVEAVLELRARQDRSRPREQRLEHRELTCRQRDRRAVEADLARRRVEPHTGMLDRRLAAPGVAAQHGAHARVQLVEFEGFDEIVVGTGIEPGDALAKGVARGQHDHRRRVVPSAQGAQHVEPAAPLLRIGQAEIEQHEVEALSCKRRVRGTRVIDPIDGVAFVAQRLAQAVADHAVVFDQQ